VKKELYLNMGKDGTCYYGTKSGDDFLFYRNLEQGKTGRIDFFIDLEFEEVHSLSEAVEEIVKDFFENQKEISFNQVYYRSSNFGELKILFNEDFPSNQEEIIKFILSKIGELR
jgi:hypothetical protein